MTEMMKKLYTMIDEKNVRNKKLIDGIYDVVCSEDINHSAFEDSPRKTKEYHHFCETYIDSLTDLDAQNNMWFDFIAATNEASHVAFKIGFQTALKLILESEGQAMPFMRIGGIAQ